MTRAMWLLNHSTARAFDLAMLRAAGVQDVFTPASYPQQVNFRSASVDSNRRAPAGIPPDDLKVLDEADWHGGPGAAAWAVANRYFDVLFFIAHDLDCVMEVVSSFKGAVVWRAFGLNSDMTYSFLADAKEGLRRRIVAAGPRFWLGTAYPHLAGLEEGFLSRREVYLPLGLMDCAPREGWHGRSARLFFVCPDVGINSYYREIHERFRHDFEGFDYVVGGSQAVPVEDPRVLGYLPASQHEENMRALRVMFYHSTEPNHVHYHPFEAVRAGMPLVFMAGGMLDRMGGAGMPGRARTLDEARTKIRRLLDGDPGLIDDIRASQTRLLDAMRPEACEEAWKQGMARILAALAADRSRDRPARARRKKIAVILAASYRGGTLRGAKLLAEAIWHGSRARGEDADVVFAHPDDPQAYPPGALDDLAPFLARRTFTWRMLDLAQARRAMAYAGESGWRPLAPRYLVAEDGIQQFCDCDAWVVVSDRLQAPLLPVRPAILMVYDYVQRYVPEVLDGGDDQPFINAARTARMVMVTTEFTRQDALQYAGVAPRRVVRVPMLSSAPGPLPPAPRLAQGNSTGPGYFLWTTNGAQHKNHANALKALDIYYRMLGGKLECHVTGVDLPQAAWRKAVGGSRLKVLGELPDSRFATRLAGAAFVWHAAAVDNGTFSVIEAAHAGVPALSSDYPAMREIDAQFSLGMAWMNPADPEQMAQQLLWMEQHEAAIRRALPTPEVLSLQSVEHLGGAYWDVIRTCL